MENLTFLGMNLGTLFSPERVASLMRVAALAFIGLPLVLLVARTIRRVVSGKYNRQKGMIAAKVIQYTGLVLLLMTVLNEFGFNLTTVFGLAGVAGIALGFASQTSVSNIISGFFLIGEQPFVVDDVIVVGGTTGQVLSIDMLSVKLRTFDNRFVRIPNETLIKSEVINVTHFPVRRVEVNVGVAYKEDVPRVREILLKIAHDNPLCLMEPEPIVIFQGFGTSSIDLFFGVWAAKADFLKLKNSIQEEIKARFDAEGIEIPFPHVSVYAGSASEPLPVRVFGEEGD